MPLFESVPPPCFPPLPFFFFFFLAGSMWCPCAVYGSGPKPHQARDVHSWRMWLLFSFCLRGPLPLLPDVRWCVEGRDCGIWTRTCFPPCPRGRRNETRQVLPHCASRRCLFSLRGLVGPEKEGGSPCLRCAPSRRVCVRLCLGSSLVLLERSRLVFKVPEAESAASFPVPPVPVVRLCLRRCVSFGGLCFCVCGRSFSARLTSEKPKGGGVEAVKRKDFLVLRVQ